MMPERHTTRIGRGGATNYGYAVFEDSDEGLREAATFARDMERAGFGQEGWHGGQPELLMESDGSKILYAWIPLEQVRAVADWFVMNLVCCAWYGTNCANQLPSLPACSYFRKVELTGKNLSCLVSCDVCLMGDAFWIEVR
jgi:hypothetical protein